MSNNINNNKNTIISYNNELSNTIRSETFDRLVDDIQNNFRLNFSNIIIQFKHKTHICQQKCYNKPNSLLEAEKCADKCYAPLFSAHENIMNLTDDKRKKLEDCRFETFSNYKEAESRNYLIKNCLLKYKEDLESSKGEIEYIYKGYYSKLESLI